MAGLSYELTRTDVSDEVYLSMGNGVSGQGDYWNQNLYGASAGARHYMSNLFIGAAFGLGFEKSVTAFQD